MVQYRVPGLGRTAGVIGVVLALAGCTSAVDGTAVSALYDPSRVAGLPVTTGPSGPRPGAPAPTGAVANSDGSDIDRLVLLSVNDLEEYWRRHYGDLGGAYRPLSALISYDSTDPRGPAICRAGTYQLVNTFYCPQKNLLAWDRGVLLATGRRYFGDMFVTGLMAHEFGHAVQYMAELVDDSTPTLVGEQRADCLAGVYLQWVAQGGSRRFRLSTTDGLNTILSGTVTLRDPVLTPRNERLAFEGHGTALDRVSAFQMGFETGATTCAAIDKDEIERRRDGLPIALRKNRRAGHRPARSPST